MKSLTRSVILLLTLCLQQTNASALNENTNRPLSISELKEHVEAPRDFTVTAYVIEKYDECPPCPPKAVCETCVLGIYVADGNHPRNSNTFNDDGIYLRTNKAQEFQIGIKYIFKVRYRMEKNAGGVWRQSGPELIDFTPVGPQK